MPIRFQLFAILFALISVAGTAGAPVPFTDIDRGQQSNIDESREVVVRTAAEWTTLWRLHGGPRPKPAVDFARSTVIGIFLGSRPSGGFGVQITGIEKTGADLVVTWRESRPGPSDVVTQVLTMPYHLVKVEKQGGAITFKKE